MIVGLQPSSLWFDMLSVLSQHLATPPLSPFVSPSDFTLTRGIDEPGHHLGGITPNRASLSSFGCLRASQSDDVG